MADRVAPTTKPARYVQKSPSPVSPDAVRGGCALLRTTSRSSSNALSASPAMQTSPYEVGHRSPLAGLGMSDPSAYGGASRGFTTVHTYAPPPPLPSHQRRANIFDEDVNLEAAFSPAQNPNRSITASLSPHVEERYQPLGFYRPVSATQVPAGRRYGQHPASSSPSSREPRPVHRAASSVALGYHVKPQKVQLSDHCGAVVVDRDPVSGAVLARYQCQAQLGKGGFANVFEFVDLTTRAVYACKVIDRSKLTRHTEPGVREEVDIHRRMTHPNVVRLVKAFSDDYYFYILLERCSTKNLLDISNARGQFGLHEIQHIMRQLCSALDYVHRCGIIHRDIKLGNIMLDSEGNVKLGDFGFAGRLAPGECKTRTCGTPNYMAPEILLCSETREGYGYAADMWSLGVVLFILTCGFPPFQGTDIASTYERIKRVDYAFPSSPCPPPEVCQQTIRALLQRDPAQRLTMEQLRQSPLLFLPSAHDAVPRSLVPTFDDCGGRGGGAGGSGRRQDENRMMSPIGTPGSPYAWGAVDTPVSQPRRAGSSVASAAYRHAQSPPAGGAGGECGYQHVPTRDSRTQQHQTLPLPPTRPPAPEVVVCKSVHFSKYGYGFLLGVRGRDIPVVLLNDRTKLVYNYTQDVAVYYARAQAIQANGVKTYCDDPRVFDHARDVLGRNPTSTSPSEDADDVLLSAARKKYAITLFLLPFLRQPIVDVQIPCTTSSLPMALTDNDGKHGLFDDTRAAATDAAERTSVYVKEVHLSSLADQSSRFPDAQIQVMAVRMSNNACQVSVHCGVPGPSDFLPVPESGTIGHDEPWKMDILLYGAGHAVIGIETEHMRFHLSFLDFARSYQTTACGERLFTASGQTSPNTRILLPPGLLVALADALRKVRCPGESLSAVA